MIKAHNKIIYPVVNTLRTPVFIENNQNIPPKNINVRYVIKTCKHNIIDAAVPSIRLYRRKNTC
jgi:hypothetical protein